MHCGRILNFHTADGTVRFSVAPTGGMPQSAPESPLVYAALVEELLDVVEAHLLVNDLPAGLPASATEETASQVQAARAPHAYRTRDVACYMFVDETYVFGTSPLQVSYTSSVIAHVFSRAQQILHSTKSEVLSDSTLHSMPRATVWDSVQLLHYVNRSGTSRPADYNNPPMKPVSDMIVLGSIINSPPPRRMEDDLAAYAGCMQGVVGDSKPS